MATFVLGWLLLGTKTTENAQTNTNCYGPYNPTPAAVWGVVVGGDFGVYFYLYDQGEWLVSAYGREFKNLNEVLKEETV
jgi:hypothetical protein